MSHLILIAGATGCIGRHYFADLSKRSNMDVIGFSRNPINPKMKYLDLYNRCTIDDCLEELKLNNFDKISYLHCVGKWDFENPPLPYLSTEYYESNIMTLQNMLESLTPLTKDIPLTLVGFGSIADKYANPYYLSAAKAKEAQRELLRSATLNRENTQGIFYSLSTLNVPEEIERRPYANTKYWLKPKDLLEKTRKTILNPPFRWQEIDVFEPMPNFDPISFYSPASVLERRTKEKRN